MPEGDVFPRTAGAVRFRITDPEEGSGVSIDPAECALNVIVNGASLQSRNLSYDANELSLTVFVAFPDGAAEHDSKFYCFGIPAGSGRQCGTGQRNVYHQGPVSPVFEIYKCEGRETYIETAMEFLVEPAFSAMALTVGSDRQLDVFTRGCYGKNYYYPEKVRELMRQWEVIDRETAPEVVTLNTFFQKAVGDRIEIQSTSGNITVYKLEDGDFKDSRISFTILQNNPAAMGDQIDELLVTVPVSFRIDPSKVDYCDAQQQRDIYDI